MFKSILNKKAEIKVSPPMGIAVVILLGVFLRLILPLRGHNFDMDSWQVVADIMAQGGNVYFETYRYKYGPIWFHILHLLDFLPSFSANQVQSLHWKITAFLTLVDIGIFVFLFRHYSLIVATLFFLNPISIIITGYHGQFDNLAVLMGFIAVLFLQKSAKNSDQFLGLFIMGLSLCVKHILFLFPLWLAFKEKNWSRKIVVIVVPYTIFLCSFLPYLNGGQSTPIYGIDEGGISYVIGQTGLIENVFLYQSFNNAPFWSIFTPESVLKIIPAILPFLLTLFVLGYIWRHKNYIDSVNLYFISLVVFSSAVTNQYLVICTPSIATQWNWFYALYTAFSTVQLAADWPGLHIGFIQKILGWEGKLGRSELLYGFAIASLFLGLIWHSFRKGGLSKNS